MTTSGSPIPVTPSVDKEVLALLLAVGTETPELDYKSSMDLDSTEGKAEFAKDVAAMSSNGGYLVVGVADDGNVIGLSPDKVQDYDEASLRSKISRWLPDGVKILCKVHSWDDGHKVALIHIAPHPDGLVVMKEGAQQSQANGGNRHIFRKGDVFTRHGSSSETIYQQDMTLAVQRLVKEQREIWRSELQSTILPLLKTSQEGDAVVQGPVSAFGWQLPLDVFLSASTELMRKRDYAPLRLLLFSPAKSAEEALTTNQPVISLGEILDRLLSVAATAAILEDTVVIDLALDSLSKIYKVGFDQSSNPRSDLNISPSQLWLEVLKRLYALGGLLVRLESWSAIRKITLKVTSVGPLGEVDSNWFRHGLTAAARANHLSGIDGQGRVRQLALLEFAKDICSKVPAVVPDLTSGDEQILNSMCQFDLLVALVAIQWADSTDMFHFYPNFAHFDGERIESILMSLKGDSPMRADLGFDSLEKLREAIQAVLNVANDERARFRQFPQRLNSRLTEWLYGNDSTESDSS